MRNNRGAIQLDMIVVLVNTVAAIATLGLVYYSKMVFKRPVITEDAERTLLVEQKESKIAAPTTEYIMIEPFTLNIKPTSEKPKNPNPDEPEPKSHYVTLGIAIAINHSDAKQLFEAVRPRFMDQLVTILGKREFHVLNTVQGRFLLRTELLDLVKKMAKEPVFTGVYFTQFIVQ